MITHAEAVELFKKCKNKTKGYKLCSHTYLHRRGKAFAVRLHETDIVMIRPDGTYRLNTGGWRTPTTKKRINRIIPHHLIIQKNGIWYAGNAYYTDRILIGPETKNDANIKLFINIQKIKARVDRKVNKFIKLVVEKCIEHDIGTWESYRKHTVPRPACKTYLKKLWQIINRAQHDPVNVDVNVPNGYNNPNTYSQLIHLATLARGHSDPQFVWEFIRYDFIQGTQSHWTLDNLRAFMRPRKPFIAEMIATGELE